MSLARLLVACELGACGPEPESGAWAWSWLASSASKSFLGFNYLQKIWSRISNKPGACSLEPMSLLLAAQSPSLEPELGAWIQFVINFVLPCELCKLLSRHMLISFGWALSVQMNPYQVSIAEKSKSRFDWLKLSAWNKNYHLSKLKYLPKWMPRTVLCE